MFCSKCGKQIVDDSIFCSYCGVKVEENKPRESPLIKACKDCVLKHLKAPDTAKFSTVDIKDVDSYGRMFYYVEVDSQNSYGAQLRTKLYVVLQKVNEDGTYEVLSSPVYTKNFINTEDVVKSVNKWNKPIN